MTAVLPIGHSCVLETPLVLHLGESTLELPFSVAEARNLGRSFNGLLQTFKDKQETEKPQKWDRMNYTYQATKEVADGISFLEVACNPNAFPSAFDAKLLVSLKAQSGIKITGEANLSQVKSDLQGFIAKHVTDKQ